MRSRWTAAAVFLLAVSGCTSSLVHGRGQVIGTLVPSSTGTTPTTATVPSDSILTTSQPPSTTVPPPPGADIARAAVITGIGDPVTADLCAAVGLDALRRLRADLTPSFDRLQYPPGCTITETSGHAPVLGVSVFAAAGSPAADPRRTQRTIAGQRIYVYPYDPSSGACERDISASGALLRVDAYPLGTAAKDEALSCAGTDAMADRLANAISAAALPRLPLASPSLSVLDACKVATKGSVAALPSFAGSDVISRGFGANCELKTQDVFLFFNFAIAETAPPRSGTPVTVGGHQLYQTAARDDFCSYASTHGTTLDGRVEEMIATATVRTDGTAPPSLCDDTGAALAAYLGAAGLG